MRKDFLSAAASGETLSNPDEFVSFAEREAMANEAGKPYEVVVTHTFPHHVDNYTKEEKIVQRVRHIFRYNLRV